MNEPVAHFYFNCNKTLSSDLSLTPLTKLTCYIRSTVIRIAGRFLYIDAIHRDSRTRDRLMSERAKVSV